MIQPSHVWVFIQKNWNQISKRYLPSHAHGSSLHNSQDMAVSQVSIDRGTHKGREVHTHMKKEENPAICSNMDEPGGCYAKWNKPVTEGQILHDSTYMRNLK